MQTRRNLEGDLDYNLYDVDLQSALYSVLLDYLNDVDGSTVDALSFAVSPLGRETFDRVLNELWSSSVAMALNDAREELAELAGGVPEGIGI